MAPRPRASPSRRPAQFQLANRLMHANSLHTAQGHPPLFRPQHGPINLLLLGLGGAYLYALVAAGQPLRNYLAGLLLVQDPRPASQEVISLPSSNTTNSIQLVGCSTSSRPEALKPACPSLLRQSESYREPKALDLPPVRAGKNSVTLDLRCSATRDNMDAAGKSTASWLLTLSAIWAVLAAGQQLPWIPADERARTAFEVAVLKLPRPLLRPPDPAYLRLRLPIVRCTAGRTGNNPPGWRARAWPTYRR